MALLEDLFENGAGMGLVLGVGALLLAPSLLPGAARVLRPVAKATIKTGMVWYRELAAGLSEATGDLIAEARAELEAEERGRAAEPQDRGDGRAAEAPA